MKKNAMLLVLVLISAFTFAQKNHHGKQEHDTKARAAKHAEQMKKDLSLNDDQFAKVKSLNEKFSAKYAVVRKDTSLTRGRAMSQMKKIRTEQDAELKTILTSDQYTKWNELKAKKEAEHKEHFKDRDRKKSRPDHDRSNG